MHETQPSNTASVPEWGAYICRGRRLASKLQMCSCTWHINRRWREMRKQLDLLSHFDLRRFQSPIREDQQLGEPALGHRVRERGGWAGSWDGGCRGLERANECTAFPFCVHKVCGLLLHESFTLLICRFHLVEAAASNIGAFYIYRHHQSSSAFNLC